jgi:hypothetical protein
MERDDVAPQRKACFSVDCPGLVDNHCHKYVPNALSPAKLPNRNVILATAMDSWVFGFVSNFDIWISGFA